MHLPFCEVDPKLRDSLGVDGRHRHRCGTKPTLTSRHLVTDRNGIGIERNVSQPARGPLDGARRLRPSSSVALLGFEAIEEGFSIASAVHRHGNQPEEAPTDLCPLSGTPQGGPAGCHVLLELVEQGGCALGLVSGLTVSVEAPCATEGVSHPVLRHRQALDEGVGFGLGPEPGQLALNGDPPRTGVESPPDLEELALGRLHCLAVIADPCVEEPHATIASAQALAIRQVTTMCLLRRRIRLGNAG